MLLFSPGMHSAMPTDDDDASLITMVPLRTGENAKLVH